jgi:DNA-directed RNA polymerase specialized sigma24 family protein
MSERANPVDPLLASELLAHHGFVRALARRLVSDAAAADDVAQDSMARLLEVGRPSSIRPFLRTVVTNVARRFGRRERRRAEVEGASAAGPLLRGEDGRGDGGGARDPARDGAHAAAARARHLTSSINVRRAESRRPNSACH